MEPPSPAFLPVQSGSLKVKKIKNKPVKRGKHRRDFSSDRESDYGRQDRHVPLDDSSSYDDFDYLDIDLESRGNVYCSETAAQADDANAPEAGDDDDAALVKRLYQGPRKCKCCINWTSAQPKALQRQRESAKEPTTHRNAVVLRYSTVRDDFGLSFPLHSIVVQSQQLKDLLYGVLKDYPGINIGRKDAVFYPPFEPLVHVWDDLSTAMSKLDNGIEYAYARAFCDAVEPEIKDTIHDRDDLVGRGLITFDLLWTLYKPDEFVFCDIRGKTHLMQVVSAANDWTFGRLASGKNLSITLRYDDFNGSRTISKTFFATQEHFTGSIEIIKLEAIPKRHHPGAERLFAELVERGKKTVSIMKGGCKMYYGHASSGPNNLRKWIEGRIIIDPKEYYKAEPRRDTIIHPVDSFGRNDPLLDVNTSYGQVKAASTLNDDEAAKSDDQLAMLRSVVRGFSLSTKTWARFDIEGVYDVEWNDNAFDQLVIPGRRKRLIKALVDRNQGRSGFDDFIKGKGQGLVMLLQGPPGTGKTLTAESIADRIHLPLYSVNAGEFHVDAVEIENTLNDILQRAAHWNAVLLIDEADAFLEKRSDWDMERNRRVAVFLRLLEYYKGVLILTTNRAVNFDPAFHSRIHLHLRFEKLDEFARTSVWKNFLRSVPNNVHEPSVSTLAEIDLNGRQIKNVIKMATLLAQSEEQTLGMEHIDDVLEVMQTRDDDEISLGSRSIIEED